VALFLEVSHGPEIAEKKSVIPVEIAVYLLVYL